MHNAHHVAVLYEPDVKIPVRPEGDGVGQIAGKSELRNELLVGLYISGQRIDDEPPHAWYRERARLTLCLIVGRDVNGPVPIIGNLADFAEEDTELRPAHTFGQVSIKDQDTAVDWIRIHRIGGFPMAEPVRGITGIKIASHHYAPSRRIGSCHLSWRKIESGSLSG